MNLPFSTRLKLSAQSLLGLTKSSKEIAEEKAALIERIRLLKLEGDELRRQIDEREAAWKKDVLERWEKRKQSRKKA